MPIQVETLSRFEEPEGNTNIMTATAKRALESENESNGPNTTKAEQIETAKRQKVDIHQPIPEEYTETETNENVMNETVGEASATLSTTDSMAAEQIETADQIKMDIQNEAATTNSPAPKIDETLKNPFQKCRDTIKEGEKSYAKFLDLHHNSPWLAVIFADDMVARGSTAQRQEYQDIADAMMVDGKAIVTDRAKKMLEENVLFQAYRLHMYPTSKVLGEFWHGVDKAKSTWSKWNCKQLMVTVADAEEGKVDIKVLDEINKRVQAMIADQKDLRSRFNANVDRWIEVSDANFKNLKYDWEHLVRPLRRKLEINQVDGWLWNEFQKTVDNEPHRVAEIVENCFIFLYTHRIHFYYLGSVMARNNAKKVPGFEEYSAKKKEDKDESLLGALPEYKSLSDSPMDIEAVEERWHHRDYIHHDSVMEDEPITWVEGKPGRNMPTIFKAYYSIRGIVRDWNEETQSFYEVKNHDIEYELRSILRLLEVHPGFSQLPTLDLLKLLHRAFREVKYVNRLCADRRKFVDRWDDEAGPITVRDLEELIARFQNASRARTEAEATAKAKCEQVDGGKEVDERTKAAGEGDNGGMNGVGNGDKVGMTGDGKEEVQETIVGGENEGVAGGITDNAEKENAQGQQSTSGDAEQEDFEDQDTFVDAQEDVQEAEGIFAGAK